MSDLTNLSDKVWTLILNNATLCPLRYFARFFSVASSLDHFELLSTCYYYTFSEILLPFCTIPEGILVYFLVFDTIGNNCRISEANNA